MHGPRNVRWNKGRCLAMALVALAITALQRRVREYLIPRRDPRVPFEEFDLRTIDGIVIKARMIPGSGGGAVIVAHPAVTGQRYAPLVEMAERMAGHFDVFTFDFRGHGGSGGRLEMNLEGPLEDLDAVVSRVRSMGYMWVGVLGFSLGGMCALLYGARLGDVDAVAAVGAPPLLPDIEPYRCWLPVWSLFLRFLGARFKAEGTGGPLPMEAAVDFPAIPLLIIHAGNEVFYPREDLEEMMDRLGKRADFWEIPGAAHTELVGREDDVVLWFMEKSDSAG
ncbi:MAG: alpha/beta fold hydrolase [Actinomycetota bacterium]|nr:alpha/beta fold hydrolase [Actinomycetota bacterium]